MITLQEMSMLSVLYTQPHRTYHNINHINECLVELENFHSVEFTYADRRIVERAIWYHDAVYNPYSKNNEANSALLLQKGYWAEHEEVHDAIIATSRHMITQVGKDKNGHQGPLPLTTQVMLDIDLVGFGKSTPECLANGENVRKEYYKTNDYDFYTGRLKFLREIMKRESLYYTDYFKEKYHEQSQKNLKLEEEIALDYIDQQSGM
jgi:predicted metal-dependent HD superfamily phosphohydrolase